MSEQRRLALVAWRHAQVRAWFLSRTGNEEGWREVCTDPRRFNRVWRRMLRLMPSDDPPPAAYRR